MRHYFSRIPAAAVKPMFDGNLYAHIPHKIDQTKPAIIENYDAPVMMRYSEPASFIKNGEAYVLFAKRGDALPEPVFIPFGVTVIHFED